MAIEVINGYQRTRLPWFVETKERGDCFLAHRVFFVSTVHYGSITPRSKTPLKTTFDILFIFILKCPISPFPSQKNISLPPYFSVLELHFLNNSIVTLGVYSGRKEESRREASVAKG